MSFFLEAARKTDFPVKNTPAPTNYNVVQQKKRSLSYAPFNTTTKLNRSQKIQKNLQSLPQPPEDNPFTMDEIKQTAQQKMNAIFKSRSQRFLNERKVNPGPGTYEVHSKLKHQTNKKKNNLNRSNQSITLMMKKTTPSMPMDSLGYKYDEHQNYQKVQGKETRVPIPGSYEITKDLIKENGLTWKPQQIPIKKLDEWANRPGPGAYQPQKNKNKKAVASCFQSTTNRFDQKKIKKTYQPGPGQYEPQLLKKSRHNNSESHFNSKAVRFDKDRAQKLGPGSYFMQKARSTSNLQYKHKKTDDGKIPVRTTFLDVKNKNPGPGEYIPYDGMTFELQKALLRKHNISQFPNSKREVFQPVTEDQPGPGMYNPEKIQGPMKGNLGYKKVEVVNLKEEDEESPSPFQYTISQNTIQKKAIDSVTKLTLTERKPFNSGAQRFKHYSNSKKVTNKKDTAYTDDDQSIEVGEQTNIKLTDLNKKTKKLVMTSVKVKVPFGISTNKYPEIQQTETGPGSYNVGTNWTKKSYSIKGKLTDK